MLSYEITNYIDLREEGRRDLTLGAQVWWLTLDRKCN